jgi:DNA-binding transcriptional regulator YhcF (GntR family)
MIVEVDTGSPVPAYEQVRAQIDTMIATGVLAAGAHLPPIRQLAADLGLAANTVARAYHELEQSGAVASRVRHGTVVLPRTSLPPPEVAARLSEAAQTYARISRQLGVTIDEAQAAFRREMA